MRRCAQSRAVVADPSPSTDPFDAAWQSLQARWPDEPAHKAFVALARQLDRLPDAAQRYRAVLDSDPGRAPEARRGLDQILAVAMLQLRPVARAAPASRVAWVVPLALGGIVVMVAVTASRVLGLPRLASPPALLALLALSLLLPWRRPSPTPP